MQAVTSKQPTKGNDATKHDEKGTCANKHILEGSIKHVKYGKDVRS